MEMLSCFEFPLNKVKGLRKTEVNHKLVLVHFNINHIVGGRKGRRYFVVCHFFLLLIQTE